MNFNAHDNIVLVAPRPVRLATPGAPTPSPYSHFQSAIHRPQARAPGVRIVHAPVESVDRLKLGSEEVNVVQEDAKTTEPAPERDPVSPRASPRSNLPSEALEEFLSILQSSTLRFPPTSPVLRASNANAPHAFFSYRRPTSCSLSPSLPEGLGLTLTDPADDIRKDSTTPAYPFKLIGGSLASPVSRMHTRNPFQRHPSYDNAMNNLLRPPTASPVSPTPPPAAAVALSPAAVPLPLPTPDEMECEGVSS